MPSSLCKSALLSASLLLLWTLLLVPPAQAHSYQRSDLHIAHPSSRESVPGAPNGVAYLKIVNNGQHTERWLAVTTPRTARVELHRGMERDGMRSMEPVRFPVELEPGQVLELRPGGFHLMLMGLDKPLEAGERVPLELSFERAGEIAVELHVEALGASPGLEHKKELPPPHAGH